MITSVPVVESAIEIAGVDSVRVGASIEVELSERLTKGVEILTVGISVPVDESARTRPK